MTTAQPLAALDHRLAALRKARPDLEPAIQLQGTLVRESLTAARPPLVESFPLPRERVQAKLRDGTPLLQDEPALVDVHYAADLFSRLVNGVSARDDLDTVAQAQELIMAAADGRLDAPRLFTEAFVQHHDHLAELALHAGVDQDLLLALSTVAVAPLLRAYAARLAPLVERADDGSPDTAAWLKGYCPICGGWPLLGELRGVERQRFLRCEACGTGWRAVRPVCPFCENDDAHSTRLLQVKDEQRFRISVCDRCHAYLKVGNAFDPPPPEFLPLDDLASVHLDMAAGEQGYDKPRGTGFRLELAVPDDAEDMLDD